jgi:hypothetical protein
MRVFSAPGRLVLSVWCLLSGHFGPGVVATGSGAREQQSSALEAVLTEDSRFFDSAVFTFQNEG